MNVVGHDYVRMDAGKMSVIRFLQRCDDDICNPRLFEPEWAGRSSIELTIEFQKAFGGLRE